jgi:uncharacterized protein involved in type VI secretion and phage assembly
MTTAAVATVEVNVDGRALDADVRRRVVSVRVASRLSQPAQCEFTFVSGWGAAAEHDACPLGAALTLRVVGDLDPLFQGEVTCVEVVHGPDGETLVRVRGYDRLHRLRKRQQLRVFESVTVLDLARQLTRDLGLEVTTEADDPGPRLERLVQHRQRDLELLVEVTERAGLYAVLRGDDLVLLTLEGTGEPVTLELGETLLEARVEANLDRASRTVTAYGWHPQRAESYEERTSGPRSGRLIDLEPDPEAVGVDGELALVDQPGRSGDETAAAAQRALDASTAHTVTLHGVARGDCRLWAGSRIDVRGLARALRGRYVVCEAVHTVDATGYRTAFTTEPPVPRPATVASSVTLGQVVGVDDPEQLGRVQVSLPTYGDADVGWLGVLCPGAGPNRGIVALPDVDDTVLVALPHGAPEQGIVLGSVYGTVPPPDPGIVDGSVRRWSMRTSDGQSVLLDDEEHRVRLQDRAGSFVELAPSLVRLHAMSDLVLEAPGRAITVRARSVDFVQVSESEPAADGPHAPADHTGGG